jgi:hypothetical protein
MFIIKHKGQVAVRPFFRPQHFSKKITWFCSEFNADSNHVIFFKKCWERKNGLTATCPLYLLIVEFGKLKR